MTPAQRRLVKSSFAEIAAVSEDAARMFYCRLFEIDGELRGLFKSDIMSQGRKFMFMMAAIVSHIDYASSLAPAISALGRRHYDYGVAPHHYVSLREAFMWTLEKLTGENFDPPVRDAWFAAFEFVEKTMIETEPPFQRSVGTP